MITGLQTGGAELALVTLVAEINRDLVDSAVICLQGGSHVKTIEALGVPVYQLGMDFGLTSSLKLAKFIGLTRRLKPDVIHGWMIHGNLAAELLGISAKARPPVLWSILSSLGSLHTEKRRTALLTRLAARLSSRPYCVLYNSRVGAFEHEQIGYNPKRTRVIPTGFNCDKFRPDSKARCSVRGELGVPEQVSLIGLIARYHPVKDHNTFLKAAAMLVTSTSCVHFLLAGHSVDKSNVELMNQIRELGLERRVHLLGERSDIPRLTASLDIASLCSVGEAFPNSIGEAMACGVPCVTTDVGDCRWILGTTGVVVPPRNPVALCEAWKRVLELPPDERRHCGEEARTRVLQEFSINAIARQYESLYLEMLGADRTCTRV